MALSANGMRFSLTPVVVNWLLTMIVAVALPLFPAPSYAKASTLLWQQHPAETDQPASATQLSFTQSTLSGFVVGDLVEIESPWEVDVRLPFVVTQAAVNELGVFSFRADSTDDRGLTITLSQMGESIRGHLRFGYTSLGIYANSLAAKIDYSTAADAPAPGDLSFPRHDQPSNVEPPEIVDVHVVYDSAAVAKYGSIQATLVEINAAMQYTNVIFERSGVLLQLEPIYGTFSEIDFNITRPNSAMHQDLINFGPNSDEFEFIRARSSALGADHTLYFRSFLSQATSFTNDGSSCGTHSADVYWYSEHFIKDPLERYMTAWLEPTNVNIVNLSCGQSTLAALLGQHMGLRSDPDDPFYDAIVPQGYPFGVQGFYSTILGDRQFYRGYNYDIFSTPTLSCGLRVCGDAESADSVSVLNGYRGRFGRINSRQEYAMRSLMIDAEPGLQINLNGAEQECNGRCVFDLPQGSQVSLVATTVEPELKFTGWQGACTVSDTDPNRCDLTLTDHSLVIATSYAGSGGINDPITNFINLADVIALDDDTTPWRLVANGSLPGTPIQAWSGTISHNESSTLTLEVARPGNLSFDIGVSSERSYDFLIVDGPLNYVQRSGEVQSERVTIYLPASLSFPKRVTLTYSKDSSSQDGADAGWASNFSFAPIAIGNKLLTVTTRGAGFVRVNGDDCIESCSYTLPQGSQVDLEAFSDEGESVSAWGGACDAVDNANRCSIILNENTEVSTTFTGAPADNRVVVSTFIDGLGSITPSRRVVVQGSALQFFAEPGPGYSLATVEGCGGQLDYNGIFQVDNVQNDCVIGAFFVQPPAQPVTVAVTGDSNTLLTSVVGAVQTNAGDSLIIPVTAAAGYVIDRSVTQSCPTGVWLTDSLFATGKLDSDCSIAFRAVATPTRQLINLALIADLNLRQCIADLQAADASIEYFDQITDLDQPCSNHDVTTLGGITNLTRLEKLRLTSPSTLSQLYNLDSLKYLRELNFDYSSVSLSGVSVGNMTSLTKFSYTNSAADRVAITGMKRLRELDLSGTRLRLGAPSLDNFPNLERVALDRTEMNNSNWLNWLNKVPNTALQSISIADNDFSGHDLGLVRYPPSLRELDANNSPVRSWTGLTANAPYLEKLGISYIDSLAEIQPLNDLRELELTYTNVTDFDSAMAFPSIEKLTLGAGNAGIEHIDWLHAFSAAQRPLELIIDNTMDYLCNSVDAFIGDPYISISDVPMCRMSSDQHSYLLRVPLPEESPWFNVDYDLVARDADMPANAISEVRYHINDQVLSFNVNPVDYEQSGWYVMDFNIEVRSIGDFNIKFASTVTVFVPSLQQPLSNIVVASPELARCLRNEAYYNSWQLAEQVTRVVCHNVDDLRGVEDLENLEMLALFGDPENPTAKPDLSVLRDLPNLRHLALVNYGLTNEDIADLASFTMFDERDQPLELHLSGNQLSDWTPLVPILETHQLWQLSVNDNLFTELPAQGELFNSKHGETILWLSDNPIAQPEVELSKLAAVTNSLDLRAERWNLADAAAVSWSPQLSRLNLDDNLFTDAAALAQSLTSATSLSWLSLMDNQLSSLAGFGDLKAIVELNVSNNAIDNIEGINGMTALNYLVVNNTLLDFFDWTLHQVPNLLTVDAFGNPNVMCFTYITAIDSARLLGGRDLRINHNMCGTDADAFYISGNIMDGASAYNDIPVQLATAEQQAQLSLEWRNGTLEYRLADSLEAGHYSFELLATVGHKTVPYRFTLEKLLLTEDIPFTDALLRDCAMALAYAAKYIRSLSCAGVTDLTGLEWLSHLTSVTLTGSDGLALSGLTALGQLEDLTTLVINGYDSMDSVALGDILAGTTALETLNLENTGLTSIDGLEQLTSLRTLRLSNNPLRSIAGVERLPKLWSLAISNTRVDDLSPILVRDFAQSLAVSAYSMSWLRCEQIDKITSPDSLAYSICSNGAGDVRLVFGRDYDLDPRPISAMSLHHDGVYQALADVVYSATDEGYFNLSVRDQIEPGYYSLRVGYQRDGINYINNFGYQLNPQDLSQPLAGLTFNDAQLAACLSQNYGSAEFTDEITELYCEGVWSLDDLAPFYNLENLYLLNGHFRSLDGLTEHLRLRRLSVSSALMDPEGIMDLPMLSWVAVNDNPYLPCAYFDVLTARFDVVVRNMCQAESGGFKFFALIPHGWLDEGSFAIAHSPLDNPGQFNWQAGELHWTPPAGIAPGAYTFLINITINGDTYSFYITYYISVDGVVVGPPNQPIVAPAMKRRGFPMWLIPLLSEEQQPD